MNDETKNIPSHKLQRSKNRTAHPAHEKTRSRIGSEKVEEVEANKGCSGVEAASTRRGRTMARCWHVTSRAKSPRNNIRPTSLLPLPPPLWLYISLPLFGRFFCSVLVIVYQAGQTKRAAGNWVSHLLPDMIDKSPPSAISAKLLFRRAAARFTPPLPHITFSSFSEQNGPNTSVCVRLSLSLRFLFILLPAQHLDTEPETDRGSVYAIN